MEDLARLFGWMAVLVVVALIEAWLYSSAYVAWGFWGLFWTIVAVAIVWGVGKVLVGED